ncbi:hypothetical protein AAFF_G00329610 [Aldrovandia affinis]|uniref:Uncharacterized protein n=1 Tax=Aldrovandia affinis TaxID=143900 RepID=A0AAD7SM90_9TELE|nr:hypothetical protein AAFF_G00329610 [Aldrovandia affinis]
MKTRSQHIDGEVSGSWEPTSAAGTVSKLALRCPQSIWQAWPLWAIFTPQGANECGDIERRVKGTAHSAFRSGRRVLPLSPVVPAGRENLTAGGLSIAKHFHPYSPLPAAWRLLAARWRFRTRDGVTGVPIQSSTICGVAHPARRAGMAEKKSH